MTTGFKRLTHDLTQVTNTMQVIRESFKTLETMEGLLSKEFKMNTMPDIKLYSNMESIMSMWK